MNTPTPQLLCCDADGVFLYLLHSYGSTVKRYSSFSWMQTADSTELVRCKKSNAGVRLLRSRRPVQNPGVETKRRRRSPGKPLGHFGKGSEVPGQAQHRSWGWDGRNVTQMGGGSDSSVAISDVDTSDNNGRQSSSLSKDRSDLDESVTDDTLWILENNSVQDRGPVVCVLDDQGLDIVGSGSVKDEDDSSDSLSWMSTASGPTLLLKRPPAPCQNCVELSQRMRKIKHWEKTFDYDPTSLSCDQWVLKKPWRPKRLPNFKGRLWMHLSRIRKRTLSCDETPYWDKSQGCSRPHVFLLRNLRRCKKKAASGQREQRPPKAKRGSSASLGGRKKKKRSRVEEPVEPERTTLQDSKGSTSHDSTWNQEGCGFSDKVCRVLNFDMGEPVAPDHQGSSRGCQVKNGSKQHSKRAALCQEPEVRRGSKGLRPRPGEGHKGDFSWLQKGGFRSLLAELESSRSTVIRELHNSTLQ
ncbi:hypothetical protein GN956_G25568 [Arapaima gigas]